MHVNSLTQIVTAFSPLALALITGLFAARSNRRRRSDVILNRLSAELEVAANIPDHSEAKEVIKEQLSATARRYSEVCAREDTLKRDFAAISLGTLFTIAGVWLGTWAGIRGGYYVLWWGIAFPLLVFGVVGTLYELAGGKKSEQAAAAQTSAPTASGTP